MALVKALDFEKKGDKHEIFNLGDIAEEARLIIAAALRQKEDILAQVQSEVQQRLETARQEGRAQGLEEGLTQGREQGRQEALTEARQQFTQESQKTIAALGDMLQAFQAHKDAILWQAEQDTLSLAIAIARKVIKQAVPGNADIVQANVREALDLVGSQTNVTIRINPMELDHFEQLAGKSDRVFGQFTSVTFEPTPEIEPGGCRVITEHGLIDGQIDTHIERIAAELLMSEDTQEQTGPLHEKA